MPPSASDKRIARLMNEARAALGVPDHFGVAVSLGIVPKRALDPQRRRENDRNRARKVSNWLKGINGPLFPDAIELLSSAGLLQAEAEAAWRGISLPEAAEAVEKARSEALKRRAVLQDVSEEAPPASASSHGG